MERRKDRDREKDVLRLNSFYFNDTQSPRIVVPAQGQLERSSLEQAPVPAGTRLVCGSESTYDRTCMIEREPGG